MTSGSPFRGPDPGQTPSENVVSLSDFRRNFRPIESQDELVEAGPPPPPPPPPHQPPSNRKHLAKRFNEQLKAAYGFLNALAAAVIVGGYISPAINGLPLPFGLDTPGLVLLGILIHCGGQALLYFYTRREE